VRFRAHLSFTLLDLAFLTEGFDLRTGREIHNASMEFR
jgi:hypothetical protein